MMLDGGMFEPMLPGMNEKAVMQLMGLMMTKTSETMMISQQPDEQHVLIVRRKEQ